MTDVQEEYKKQAIFLSGECTKLEEYWKPRNDQIEKDKDIINLVKPVRKETDKIQWMTNEPKVFFDTSRALISLYPPRFMLPISINYSPEEKDKMNKAERFLIGIYRELNRRSADTGGVHWLWDLAYWVLLGWYSVFNIVQKTESGVQFRADLWNPMTVYPQWDSLSLIKCARIFEVDKITANTMVEDFTRKGLDFDFTEPIEEYTKVVNYWQKRVKGRKTIIENAIMIGGQIIKPLTLQKRLTKIPIRVGAIGIPDRLSANEQTRRGESIIAANRNVYEYTNAMFSLMTTILAATAFPEIIEKTVSGREAYKSEDFRGYGGKKTYKLNETVDLLKHASTPQEVNLLFSYTGQQIQKGSLPNSVYGSLPFEVSGFALSQLLAAIKYKLGPYLNALQFIMSNMMTDFLYQYKSGNFEKVTLSTENPYALKRGMTYIEEFSPEDIPENIFVDVTIPISSQVDKTQAILNARQALNPPQILSLETLWENELGVPDSEQEYQRIRQDQIMNDPFIRQVEIIEKMWERVELYRSQGNNVMADALKRYIQGLEVQLGIRQGIIETSTSGITPQLSPPEMSMSPNPDQLRAMRGIPPSGLNRRTQTPEERAEGKSGLI